MMFYLIITYNQIYYKWSTDCLKKTRSRTCCRLW
jgi:hypothetical protein